MKELGKYLKSIKAFTIFGKLKTWADFILWNETAFPFATEQHTIKMFKKVMSDIKHENTKSVKWL
jgi:hypothetical protein